MLTARPFSVDLKKKILTWAGQVSRLWLVDAPAATVSDWCPRLPLRGGLSILLAIHSVRPSGALREDYSRGS